MHGDRRPFPVMLSRSTRRRSCPGPSSRASRTPRSRRSRSDPEVHALIQAELDKANAKYAQVEQVKKFVDPRPRPLAGDRRADADAEGQAQRRQREVRRPLRRALRRADAAPAVLRRSAAAGRPSSLVRVRTDPTDNGGLFVGRRPGTAPVRYRDLPERATRAGGASTRCSRAALLAADDRRQPAASGARSRSAGCGSASQRQYLTDSLGLGLLVGVRRAAAGAARRRSSLLKRLDQSVDPRAPRRRHRPARAASSAASSPYTARRRRVAVHGLARSSAAAWARRLAHRASG